MSLAFYLIIGVLLFMAGWWLGCWRTEKLIRKELRQCRERLEQLVEESRDLEIEVAEVAALMRSPK